MGDARMKTGIFLQVRLFSERLNRKAVLPLSGIPVVTHAMRALSRMKADVFALLTDEQSFENLSQLAASEGFQVFQGPGEDVLQRYCMAARFYGVERIVRATGDNPLVSAKMGNAIVRIHAERQMDLSHFLGLPMGTGVEVIEAEALYTADRESGDAFEREHITTFFYRRMDHFKVLELDCPSEFYMKDIIVSLDTREDYTLLSRIYRDLFKHNPIEIDQLVKWIKEHEAFLRRYRLEKKDTSIPSLEKRYGDRSPGAVSISDPHSSC
jgi:spore coat polysaccharide biosynthesis protein SpsF